MPKELSASSRASFGVQRTLAEQNLLPGGELEGRDFRRRKRLNSTLHAAYNAPIPNPNHFPALDRNR